MYRYGTQNCLTEPGDTLRSERGIRLARLARLPVRFRPVTVFSGAGG